MLKAVIINGAYEDDKLVDSIHSLLIDEMRSEGWEVESYTLREVYIKDCQGCFKCWLKTPGLCIYEDISTEISREYVNCDLFIILTPVEFGCYSYHTKKYIDKMIPNVLPFFKTIKGEIHHIERYERYPDYYIIGVVDEGDSGSEEIFRELIERNFINFHQDNYEESIFYRNIGIDEVKEEVVEKLSRWRVRV